MIKYDRFALAIFLSFFAVYLFTASGHPYAADEETIIYVTAGIMRRADFAVPAPGEAPTLGMMPGTDGRFYSQTGLASSLIAAPFFGIGEAFSKFSPERFNGFWTRFAVVTFLNPLLTALTAALLYSVCVWLGYRRRIALLVAFAFGFATIAWWFTKTALTEPFATLGLLVSFAGLLQFRKAHSRSWLLASGMACGIVLLTRLQLIVLVPLVALYLFVAIWENTSQRTIARVLQGLLIWGVPIVAALLLISWYNWTRYGSPLESGYSAYARLLGLPRVEWVYGLLFSPGKSLFWYSPPLIAGVIGFWQFGKKFPRESLLLVTAVLVQILFYSGYEFWHGDSGWGPRFLVPTIPFLILPLTEILSHTRTRWLGYALIVVGLFVQLPSLLVNTSTVVLLAPNKKPWDTVWMTDWTTAPIIANWNLMFTRLTLPHVNIPELPPLPNDRFIWFNEPSILHRADVWWWYLPNTGMPGNAVLVVMGLLGLAILLCLFLGVSNLRRIKRAF